MFLVSLFFHRVRNLKNTPKLKNLYDTEFDHGLDSSLIEDQLATFIRHEFDSVGYGNYLDWTSHVMRAMELAKLHDTHCLVKYEALLRDPAMELDKVINQFTGRSISIDKLDLIVKLFQIDLVKNNQVLSTAETTFIRKGGAGGWKDYFCEESECVMDELAGEALRKLDYVS